MVAECGPPIEAPIAIRIQGADIEVLTGIAADVERAMAEAAGIPLVGLTAWQALVEKGQLRKGQKVFIHAGSGGVGTLAVAVLWAVGFPQLRKIDSLEAPERQEAR